MRSYTYFQRMAAPLPPPHLPVLCPPPSTFILHIYTLLFLYGIYLIAGYLNTTLFFPCVCEGLCRLSKSVDSIVLGSLSDFEGYCLVV